MFSNPRTGTTFAGPASVGLHSEIVRKALIRRSILEPDLRRLSRLGMVSEEGVFAEDFTCRQLDGVIINLGSDYMPYGHLPHEPGSVCRGRRVGRTYESRRGYTHGVYRTFIGHPEDLFVLRITTVRKLLTAVDVSQYTDG